MQLCRRPINPGSWPLAEMHTLELTNTELSLLLMTIGALLAELATEVPPGQLTSPEMLVVEALQDKLMDLQSSVVRQ